MRTAGRFFQMLICSLMLIPPTISAAEDPMTVLLIGKDRDHPYGTHMYLFECELLAKCLRQTPGVEAIVSKGWPTDAKLLADVDVIVTYSAEGGTELAGGKPRAEFERMMARGVGLVALHWSTGAANNEIGERWRDTLGGWFSLEFSRLNVTKAMAQRAQPDHPIARGWDDFDLRDEYYLGLRFHEQMTPQVVVRIDDVDYPVAWSFERPGGGRSFGFVCGHFHDVFLTEQYRKIVMNAIHWTGHHDLPEQGAPIAITEEDGVLPPDDQAK